MCMRTLRLALTTLTIAATCLSAACSPGADRVDPTPTPAPTATALPAPDLSRYLPTSATLPLNFLTQPAGRQIASEVAATWPDPIAARTQLQQLGFVEALQIVTWINPALTSTLPGTPNADAEAKLESVTVVAMRWETETGAADSTQRHADAMLTSDFGDMQRLAEADLPPSTAGVRGTLDPGGQPIYATFIWVYDGLVTVLYSGFSGYGDPTTDLIDVVNATREAAATAPAR